MLFFSVTLNIDFMNVCWFHRLDKLSIKYKKRNTNRKKKNKKISFLTTPNRNITS